YCVRQIGDASRTRYIAKRQHTDAKEWKMMEAIEAIEPRCENIIRLINTIESNVGKCIVLPERMSVADELYNKPKGGALRGRYIDLSRQLARAITFLHDHNIAHLDVKPSNLVYTSEYRLELIDFDTAVFVKDEDKKIEGYIGSEGWMAPEIGPRKGFGYKYSPIRADRYSCGCVFKNFVLDGGIEEGQDEGLREFADRLTSWVPSERPQLREWCEGASGKEDAMDGVEDSKGLVAEENEEQMDIEKSVEGPL
ncbi:hypothetical protein EW145_g6081, partial [Phellinidium pouzarii]